MQGPFYFAKDASGRNGAVLFDRLNAKSDDEGAAWRLGGVVGLCTV